jgi:rubredoxin
MSDQNRLSPEHLTLLREGSGISDDVIIERGYRTITDPKELRDRGFSRQQSNNVPGLLLPVHTTDGNNGLYCYRPDVPRVVEDRRKKRNPDGSYKTRIIKYEIPKDESVRLDCPPSCRPMLADPSKRLWLTEGQKKADCLASRGLCAIDLLGVWNFKGKNEFGGVTLLADFDLIALGNREICIVFDSDVMTKREVQQALARITEILRRKGAHVRHVYLPLVNGHKVGVDDYLINHSVEELEALIDAPRPVQQPEPPKVELLDTAPAKLRKPLALIENKAYAAIWPHVQITVTETSDKDGNIVKYDEPKKITSQQLFIVRSDGVIFGEGVSEPMEKLGIEVCLTESPQEDRLWSTPGVKSYRQGERPAAPQVFSRIVAVVDPFIDFDHSLASQQTMAELVACYILATWFLDAFTVIGFLWPNGERGSGKTQLITIVAELSYLGQVILAGASYASLRDLADYGATLGFDDAENLTDPKRTDPDKRALLLAGNRRGNTVPVKEPGPDRTWRTRYVNTFCPRLFSAIELPDPVLASRTIIIPLIKTPDRHRANADPSCHSLWPHDRVKLIDDLWALALANLSELSAYEALVNERARLTGRNLEPWRAVLAVAAWLEDKGVKGAWERMERLSHNYQSERRELESSDLMTLVVRALCEYLEREGVKACEDCEGFSEDIEKHFVRSGDISEVAKELIEKDELEIKPDGISPQKVGYLLKKMRFEKGREGGTGKSGWKVSNAELKRWLLSLGIVSQKPSQPSQPSHCNDCGSPSDELGPDGLCPSCGADKAVFEDMET